jgi:alkylated DNA repair dioxygenase AlkB
MQTREVFGPAEAKGLLVDDGKVWSITMAGVAWVEQFKSRSPWKDTPSKRYSHWIKVQRTRHKLTLVKGTKAAKPPLRRAATA